MYKCGWQGCEKAYGTLNHLNAHVTMQSHGQKRTPEGEPCILNVANPRLWLDCEFVSYVTQHKPYFLELALFPTPGSSGANSLAYLADIDAI